MFLFLLFFLGAVEECLICLIIFVVKLLAGFEVLVPPLKNLLLGVNVVILDGASTVQMLKVVVVSTAQ